MIKVGDQVRRISGETRVMPLGWEGVVQEVAQLREEGGSLKFAEFDHFWFAENFEIVESAQKA